MIDRYTIKINPAVSHADLVKKLDEMKDFNPEEMRKLHYLKGGWPILSCFLFLTGTLDRITPLQ
jgi:hypothetical protein